MIVTTEVVRGNTIRWDAAFSDYLDAPVHPASVTVGVNYVQNGSLLRATQSFAMAWDSATETFFYEWDSSVAAAGDVQWTVFSSQNDVPVYVADGSFELQANAANLAAVEAV